MLIHLSLLNFRLIYFSGTQLGTDFPDLFLFPTFSYPSQQGSAFFVAAFFVAAFLGAAFFVVAIKMFLKQNQRISQNIYRKNYFFNFWQCSQVYVALLPLPIYPFTILCLQRLQLFWLYAFQCLESVPSFLYCKNLKE